MVEQVFYTWANEGLSGRGMLQPVAASRGFRRLSESEHKRALRLCSYDAGSAVTHGFPRAFGWIDSGATRFAFQREYLADPSLQRGRPGNFAAHVMIGPASVLSAPKLLASFGTASWWKGPDSMQELALPASEWSQLEVARELPIDHDIAAEVLSALMSGQTKVRSKGQTEHLIAALRWIANRIPSLIEGLSFSTFEGARLSDWFDIVGNTKTSSIAITRDAEYFLTHPRVSSILPVIHGKTDPARSGVLALARSLIAVHRNLAGGDADVDSISQLLRFPVQVPMAILEFPGFREALATSISENSPNVVRAMQNHGHAIPTEALGLIGEDVGQTVVASQVDAVYRRFAKLPSPFLEAYTQGLLARLDIAPFVATCAPENLRFFFESSEYGAASADLRSALEMRLAGVGAPAHLFYSHLSDDGWNALFASLTKRRRTSWDLTPEALGLIVARAATNAPWELEQFFLNAEGQELKTRTNALSMAPGLAPSTVSLSAEAARRLLSTDPGDVDLSQLLTAIDLSVFQKGPDRALVERLVRRLLDRYELDGSFLLSSGFWSAIGGHQDLVQFAQARLGVDRPLDLGARATHGRVGRTIAFLKFEQQLLHSSPRLILGNLSRQQLAWLAVVTSRAARQGAGSRWVKDSLTVLVDHASSWQRIGSWLVEDQTRTAILQLLRYLAVARPGDYDFVAPFLDDDIEAALSRGR